MGACEVTEDHSDDHTEHHAQHELGDESSQGATTGVVDLASVGEGLLRDARNQPAHRAARTIMASTVMRCTIIALLEGAELNEHASPPAATLQAVTGGVLLVTGDHKQAVRAGQVVRIPPQRHSLRALSDAVVVLTVALH
jgi:quercetin dioxygenase-like cupin family protein